MVALDHVETHLAPVLDDPHVDGPQALELVDVVAIGVRIAAVRVAVLILLQPHHLGLGAVAQPEAVILLELIVDAAQVAAAIGRQVGARILLLLAVAEQRAEHARHALVPGQLHEGLRLGHANELGRLGAVAQVLAAPIEEQVDGCAVDELEAAIGDILPMLGRDALAHDAARHRDELQVEVFDAELVDLGADLLDQIVATRLLDE